MVSEITQMDREAMSRMEPNGKERDQILRGKRDKSPTLANYARHREAAKREVLEAAHFIAVQLGEMGTAKCLRLMIDEGPAS